MTWRSMLWLFALAGLAGGLAPLPARADSAIELGRVVAVDGLATATTQGLPARPLVCGDAIHADERLETGLGSRLVIARDGRHVHLGPQSLWIVRRDEAGEALSTLLRGDARILDGRDRPEGRIATAAGTLRSEAVDLELRRLADGSLQLCDWSQGLQGSCRRIDAAGGVWPSVAEGPRLDLGIRDLCPWQGREGFVVADFMSTPPVSSPPAAAFEPELVPELDPEEPGCAGDECTSPPDLPDPAIEWSVDPTIVFIP